MENFKNELKSMFTEHWKYMALSTACQLRIFDKIYAGEDSLPLLAGNNQWHPQNLSFLTTYLENDAFLTVGKEGKWQLSPKGHLLREGNPEGLLFACLNWSSEHLDAWKSLNYSVQTGKSSFEKLYQKPFFDYIGENPEKLHEYHMAMYQYARDDYRYIANIVDFSNFKAIIDVGGGYGALAGRIKEHNPNTKCYVLDLEPVTKGIPDPSLEKLPGNFFNSIPAIADCLVLSRILHDWADANALKILENCYTALPENGILCVIENCTDRVAIDLSLLSLNMAVMCSSFERSFYQYNSLCQTVGFSLQKEYQLNQLQTILIFEK